MCGENVLESLVKRLMGGSPPHVRGKRMMARVSIMTRGITPACAGKTFTFGAKVGGIRDHPRMCGENYITFDHLHIHPGSPPHVRGKR